MEKVRLILSSKQNAKKNMQIDKFLASSFKEADLPIFRLYTWSDSFTVGVSQKCEDYLHLKEKYNDNCAKRITGGGVLFHGNDISYSLILPSNIYEDLSIKKSYEKNCQFLLKFYEILGLKANFVKDLDNIELSKNEFCQLGFEAYDILISNKKIGGNAQKRTKKMIFQHGSIPIKKVRLNENMGTSLEELGINISYDAAISKLIEAFEESFNTKLELFSLDENEIGKI